MLKCRNQLVILILLALAFGQAAPAAAANRVALVIGNSTYRSIGDLRNPINDARLMATTLTDLGFEVIERLDADQRRMKVAIKEFGKELRRAGRGAVGLFYYAGHGVQVDGVNYLVPVNVAIEDEADIDIEAVSADSILAQMASAGNRLNIVIMDACRNNPFKRSFRSAARGLARMNASRGTLIAYATAPGDVAADGDAKNSPYTAALATAMRKPGVIIEQVFKDVRNKVIETTGGRQVPWEASSLTGGDFFFNPASARPAPAPVAAAPQPAPQPAPAPAPSEADIQAEREFWVSIKDSDDPVMFAAYLSQYPQGRYVRLARSRIANLARNRKQPSPPQPKPSPPPKQVASLPKNPAPPPEKSRSIADGMLQVRPSNRSDCGFVRSTGRITADTKSFSIRFRDSSKQTVTIKGGVSPSGDISKSVRIFIGGESIHANARGSGKLIARFRNGEFSGKMTLVGESSNPSVCTIELYAKADG